MNESLIYNALGYVLHNFDADRYEFPNLPYWLIFDTRFVSKYQGLTSRPGDPVPPWAVRGDTIEELADDLGLGSPHQ